MYSASAPGLVDAIEQSIANAADELVLNKYRSENIS